MSGTKYFANVNSSFYGKRYILVKSIIIQYRSKYKRISPCEWVLKYVMVRIAVDV